MTSSFSLDNKMLPPPHEGSVDKLLEFAVNQLSKHSRELQAVYESNTSRHRSWDGCFNFFQKHFLYSSKPDFDLATLHLAWYLASFGMYRGSSPLLQHSRQVLKNTVVVIHQSKIKPCWTEKDIPTWDEVNDLKAKITASLSFKTLEGNIFTPSKLLVSKILMGTVCCCPSYDLNFSNGVNYLSYTPKGDKKERTQFPLDIKNFSDTGFSKLGEFLNNSNYREQLIFYTKNRPLKLPLMRSVDLFFWCIGRYIFEKQKSKSKGVDDEQNF